MTAVHPLWSLLPPNSPETLENFKDTQKWLKSDFPGFPSKWLKSDSKLTSCPEKVSFETLLSHFKGNPGKSLFSHFWVSLKLSRVSGELGGNKDHNASHMLLALHLHKISHSEHLGLSWGLESMLDQIISHEVAWVPRTLRERPTFFCASFFPFFALSATPLEDRNLLK